MADHPMLKQVLRWADRQDDIRAIAITGSLARADDSTDRFSDLDLQIITTDSKRYTDADSWLDSLGEFWIRFPIHEDVPYRLVWFAGGIKVDFQFLHPEAVRAQIAIGALSDEYQRGYVVALDKDGLFTRLPPSPHRFPAPPPPSAHELEATINEFWFEAIHVAQFIRRREFWVAKHRDWTMKEMLLRLLEWHARAIRGPDTNTWLLGKRVLDWADPDAAAAIPALWPRWNASELWQGLLLQISLFARLSRELTHSLGHEFDETRYHEIADLH